MKHNIVWAGAFLSIIALSWCSPSPSLSEPQVREDNSAIAVLSEIVVNDKHIGSIVPDQQSDLSFKMPWRITQVFVEEWDTVKRWDVLAAIESSELYVAASSSNSMIAALQQLKSATRDMFDSQIEGMKYKLNQIDLNKQSMALSGTNIGNSQLWTAELGQATSIAEFDTSMNLLDQQEYMLYTNAQNAFSQTKVFLDPLGIFVDELFGVSADREDDNDDFDIYLWAKDANALTKTKNLRGKLNAKYEILWPKLIELSQRNISNPVTEEEKKEIYSLLTDTESFLIDTRELLRLVYRSLDQSIDDARVLPLSKINELKQYTTIYQSNLEKVLLSIEWNYTVGIKWSKDNINAFNRQALIQRTLLGQKVSISKNQVQLTKAQLDTQLSIIEQQYKESKEWLKTLEKQKLAQLAQLDSQIAQVDGQYRQTNTQLAQTQLLAPYDGIITQKLVEDGEIINAGYPVISIWSLWIKKVMIQVADKNINTVHLNDSVSVYIPALDQTYSGVVSNISPMANMLTRRRDVEIKFLNTIKDLPLWSQANVLFKQHTIEGIVIPQQSIQTFFGATTITKIGQDGLLEQLPINILWCDIKSCVISGSVNQWDKIRVQ